MCAVLLVVCVSCRACRDVFCDSCSRYRLLCRDLHDKNAIIRVRVCRSCFSKHRNDRARTPKRKSGTSNTANTPHIPQDKDKEKHSKQATPTHHTTTTTAAGRKTAPSTPTSATARSAQTITVSTLPASIPAPKRNPLLDKQIAQLNDGEGGGKKRSMLDILKREVEKDDTHDRGEQEEEEEEEEEGEEEEEEEGEEGEEEEEEEEQGVEGSAADQSVIEEGEEVEEEEEEEEEEEGEEAHEIMSIPADSLASVKHSVAPTVPTPRAQQRSTAGAQTQSMANSATSTVTAGTPRATAASSKEAARVVTADKETQRGVHYIRREGRGKADRDVGRSGGGHTAIGQALQSANNSAGRCPSCKAASTARSRQHPSSLLLHHPPSDSNRHLSIRNQRHHVALPRPRQLLV